MSVRGYFNRSGTVGVTEAPWDAYWSVGFTYPGSSAVTRPHQSAAGVDSLTSQSQSTSATANIPWIRHVSDPLPAGPVEGTFRAVILGLHQVATVAKLAVVVTLWNGDCTVKRGTLGVFTSAGYFTTTSASQTVEGALTPVTAQAGDRILIATGQNIVRTDGSTSRAGTLRIGNPTAATADAAFGTGSTTDARPWWEFTQAIYTARPAGLAVVPTTDSLALSWSAVAGATGYDVRLDGGFIFDSGADLAHDFLSLDSGTSYTLEVRARTAAGVTAWSSIVGTTEAVFSPPDGLAVVAHPTSLDLSWNPAPGATGYLVRIDFGPFIDVGTATSYTFAGLEPLTGHDLEVYAYNDVETSGAAFISEATTALPGVIDYTVEVRIGVPADYDEWTATSGVVPTDPEASFLADPAEWSWAFPDGLWPAQPSPVQLRLSIITPTPLDSARVDLGRPIQAFLDLTSPVTGRAAAMWGRITDLDVTPVRYAIGPEDAPTVVDGLRYDLTAVDYTADYAESSAGDADLPQQSGAARLAALCASSDALDGAVPLPGAHNGMHGTLPLNARQASPGPVLDLLLEVLRQVPSDTSRYGVLAPNLDVDGGTAALSAASPLAVDYLPTFIEADYGVWDVDANTVDRFGRWFRSKLTAPNRVRLVGQPLGDAATRPRRRNYLAAGVPAGVPRVTVELGTELAFTADWPLMADMYLGDIPATSDRWMVDEFTLYGEHAPEALVPMWFPDHSTLGDTIYPDPRIACYIRPVKVSGIPAAQDPTGRGYFAGQLAGVTLTLSGGRPLVRFRLRRAIELGT